LYAFTGHKLDMVTMIMPSLVTIIGIANCIHILRHAGAAYGNGDRKSRVVKGVGFIVRPCLFNTLTTSAGFAALLASPMPVIRSLGLFSAAGLLIVFLLSVVVCIWALQWECAEPTARPGLGLQGWAVRTASLAVAHPRGVLTAALIVTAAAAWGAAQVNVDTYSIQFLKPDHRVRKDYAFIEKRFGGYMPMEFVLHSDNGILRSDVVRQVADWQNRVEAGHGVGWSFSVADLMASGVFVSVFPDADFCESDRSRLWSSMIDCPNEMRVSFGIPMQSAREAGETLEKVAAQARLPDDVALQAGAYLPLYVKMIDHIVGSQINSFALAFIFVFAAFGMFFRSWRYLLIAIPANLLPVLFTLGAMGWLGVRLDVATVVIAAVVLGIVVDDTILLLYHLRHQRNRLKGNSASILAAAKSAGTSMVMTTLVLAAGLLVYGFAEINSIVWFGLLISQTMLVALAADLLIVPALSVFILPKTGTSRVDLSPTEK
ncbi:MAG: efflux RND transporter permease subunit, partial [Gammaproteobacteria bacterium]